MPKNSSKGQIEELNWIRGVSALLIVLYHYTTQYHATIGHLANWPFIVPWGCGAVNVFFLLTGFLTIYALKMDSSPIQFVWKRAKRLYPAYWICIVITSIVMGLFLPENLRDIKTILINLTMLQNFVGVTNVDGVYWTLSFELIFYFYVAVLLLIKTRSLKLIRNIAFVWIGISYIYLVLETIGVSNIAMNTVRLVLIPYFCAPFAGGILLAVVAKNRKRDYFSYGGVLASIVLSFLLQELSYAVLYGIVAVMLFVVVEKRFVTMDSAYSSKIEKGSNVLRPLAFVASISYPLYLLHQFIGFAIIVHLERAGLTNELMIFIPIILLLALAWVVQLGVDKLMHIGKR